MDDQAAPSSQSLGARLVSAVTEKVHALRSSRELLALYKKTHSSNPELEGRALYQRIVMDRLTVDDRFAQLVLRRAEQSFCDWPSSRELRYRDVVLYIVIVEYLRSHVGTVGTQTNMRKVVDRFVSETL